MNYYGGRYGSRKSYGSKRIEKKRFEDEDKDKMFPKLETETEIESVKMGAKINDTIYAHADFTGDPKNDPKNDDDNDISTKYKKGWVYMHGGCATINHIIDNSTAPPKPESKPISLSPLTRRWEKEKEARGELYDDIEMYENFCDISDDEEEDI